MPPPLITLPPPAPGENPMFGKARDNSNETSAEIIPLTDTATDTSTNNPSSDIPYPYSS